MSIVGRNLRRSQTAGDHDGTCSVFLSVAQATLASVLFAFLFYLGSPALTDAIVAFVAPTPSLSDPMALRLVISIAILLSFAAVGPKEYGLTLGRSWREVPLLLKIAVPVLAVELGYLLVVKTSPLSGLSWHSYTLVPVVEELLFRSLILTTIKKAMSGRFSDRHAGAVAVVVSAVAFSAAHGLNFGAIPNSFLLFQLLYAFVLGLLLGVLRLKSESILPCIALHCTFNVVGIALF